MLCCPFLVILRFSAIRNLLSDLSLFEFRLVRRLKATYSVLKSLLLEAKKKDTLSMPAAPIPPQNHSTGLSAPFQLISKSNSSPQRCKLCSFSILTDQQIRSCVIDRSYLSPVQVAWLHSLIVALAWLVIGDFRLRLRKKYLDLC